jgi:hypothetical protein
VSTRVMTFVTKFYTLPYSGSRERGNEPSSSIKGREFLDLLSGYQFLKEDCAP